MTHLIIYVVEVDISEDSGSTWLVTDTSVTGDIDSGVSTGVGNTITWDAGTDFDEQEQADLRVRVRATDKYQNAGLDVESSDFTIDTLNPVINVAADLQSQPNAGDATVLIGGSFTETNPDTNDFYVEINDGSYTGATAGDLDTASPSNQATAAEVTLDGSDYISAVKITHTDDFGQTVDNENTSPTVANKYVKPYTPDAPTVDNPSVGGVDVLINLNSSETAGLEYAIYETTQAKYVQANGTLGVSAVWQTRGTGAGQWGEFLAESGKVNVNGLANHSYTYEFKTVSRNISDAAHAASSESALSGGASSDNQSPVIVLDSVSQTTDGTQYVTINYTGSDLESESSNIITVEYSTDNSNWYTMTEKSGVGSDGTASLAFASGGTAHDFMWDVGTDLVNSEDSTTYIRLQANDATTSGAIVTSDPFTIDTKNPIISSVTGSQVSDSNNVTFGYTLTDLSNSTIDINISEDSGSTWAVTDTSTTGDIGLDIEPGAGKSITWDAGTDFNNQDQSDMQVQVRGLDAFGNQGSYAVSLDFSIDTANPVVSNVSASQDAGANTVTITYDVSDTNNSTIQIDISEDSGSTWGVADTSVTGDVGEGITPGAGKSIIWDASADFPNRDESDIRVRVRAIDAFANNSGNVESSDFTLDTLGPVVSNVTGVQTLSSESVVFTYDLSDSVAVDVEIDISDDGGSTWDVTDTSITGDVGLGVAPGVGKTITWDAGTDFNLEDQNDIRVRIRGIDSFTNSSGNVESSNFIVDTLDPAVNSTADLQAQPIAGDTLVSIGGSFTESNPNTNDFYIAINGGSYSGATSGDSDTASPSNQATTVGVTLDGDDYISKVKISHVDDYAHTIDNENLSPAVAYQYVKPYTPQAPTVDNPQNTSVDIAVNAHASETSGLEYAIYENSTAQYVQLDGTLNAGAVWRTAVAWGTTTVSGLTSPVAQYGFQVKSRNTSDPLDASTSESNLSSVGSISNTAPSISITSSAQQGSSSYALIDYTGTDAQNDTNDITSYEYSTDNITWYTMTEESGVGSDGISDLLFTSVGANFTFGWDIATDLPNTGDPTVYARLQSSDTLAGSNLAVSSAFAVDTLGPVISNIATGQTPGSNVITFTYDLTDDSVTGNTIEMEISSDSGSTWVVPITTLSGDIGAGVTAGVGKSITWDAGVDFNNQESSTMKVRIRGTDEYSNTGSFYESANFVVDSKSPVISNVSAEQVVGTTNVELVYDLADATSAGHLVEIDISDDGGSTWSVTDTSVAGSVGAGQTTGTSKTITWDAGTDFDDEYQADIQIRIRSLDYYGNQGSYIASSNFVVDTSNPVISNVSATQDAGANTATFTYDLADDTASDLEVSIDISEDGGVSWTVTDVSVTGEIGASQTAGLAKSIAWDAGSDFAGQDVSNMRVRVYADDSFGNASAMLESLDFALDTAAPSGLAGLTKFSATETTATLNWTAATDTNFDHYELWYGIDQADVQARSGTALEWDTTDDATLSNAFTISTVITGINTTVDLYIKIWAIDDFGNEVTIDDINVYTEEEPEPEVEPAPVVVSGGSGRALKLIKIDTRAPDPPILYPLETYVNYARIKVDGLAEPGSIIRLYDDGAIVDDFAQIANEYGRFEAFINFDEGSHNLQAVAVDDSDNESELSDPVDFTIDLTPPSGSSLVSPADREITDTTPIFTGIAEPFATVEIVLDFEDEFVAEVDENGNWVLILPTASELDLGDHELLVRVIDQAGNTSPTSSFIIQVIESAEAVIEQVPPVVEEGMEGVAEVIVLTPPLIPTQDLIEEVSEAVELPGLPSPQITRTVSDLEGNEFVFAGFALPNSNVAVYIHSSQALAYYTESDDAGYWSVEHSQDLVELSEGDHTIYAVAVDPEAKVKTVPGPVSIFTVEKNEVVAAFNYLNLNTTLITLIILTIVLVWLLKLKRQGVKGI